MYVNPVAVGVFATLFVLETMFIGVLIYFGSKNK